MPARAGERPWTKVGELYLDACKAYYHGEEQAGMKEVINEIMDALANEEPEGYYAPSEDGTEGGFDWLFKDGSLLWLDFTRDGTASIVWRKGRNGKVHKYNLKDNDHGKEST
jgi:hypothetical protein